MKPVKSLKILVILVPASYRLPKRGDTNMLGNELTMKTWGNFIPHTYKLVITTTTIATANLPQDWLNKTSGYFWESRAKNLYTDSLYHVLIMNLFSTHRKL